MDDGGARLVVRLLADPLLLESGQQGRDGAANPHGVLALRGHDDLDLHRAGCQGSDLFLHPVRNAGVHSGPTRQHRDGVEVLADVDVTLHDGIEGSFVNAAGFHAQEARREESLRAAEPLTADGDDLPVRQLLALLQGGAGGRCGHLLLELQGSGAELLLDVTDDFPLGRGGEAVAMLREDLHEVACQVPASQVQTQDGVGEGVPLVDGHHVGDPVTGVHHDAGGAARGLQGQHSLDGHVQGRGVEGLEHDLGHLLTIGLEGSGGPWSAAQGALGGCTQLFVEGVVPDLLHVVPVGDDAVLDGVLESQDASLALGFIIYIGVLLAHAHHHALVLGAPHDREEDGPQSIITRKAGLAHARACSTNGSNIIIHGELVAMSTCGKGGAAKARGLCWRGQTRSPVDIQWK